MEYSNVISQSEDLIHGDEKKLLFDLFPPYFTPCSGLSFACGAVSTICGVLVYPACTQLTCALVCHVKSAQRLVWQCKHIDVLWNCALFVHPCMFLSFHVCEICMCMQCMDELYFV